MELQEFISKTLIDIKNGLRQANMELARQEGKTLGKDASAVFAIPPHGTTKGDGQITFDIAVTVTKENTKTGGGGIKVAVVNIGGELKDAGKLEHVSRIKFSVAAYSWTS